MYVDSGYVYVCSAYSGNAIRISDEDKLLPEILVDVVQNSLEVELTSLRAQAGDELKTLALIAAGATPCAALEAK